MAEETTQAVEEVTQDEGTATEPQGTEEKDWKAEYDKLLSQSRKWEERAKKNVAAAKELDEIKAQSMTDAERASAAEKRAEEAEAKVAEFERKAERASLIEEVAAEKGVDAEWLSRMEGNDREAIEGNAEFLAKKLKDAPIYPSVDDKGQTKPKQVSEKDIREIKDPAERIKARAELIAKNRH